MASSPYEKEEDIERATDMLRRMASGGEISPGKWALRGLMAVLLTAGVGLAIFVWPGSSGDAAKKTPPQSAAAPALPARSEAANVPVLPDLAPQLQLIVRDLASLGKEIEQLKMSQETLVRDGAKFNQQLGDFNQQLKASQEGLSRDVVRLTDQLSVAQQQAARDNGNAAEQIKEIQDRLLRLSQASEQNVPPKIAAASPRPKRARARPVAPALPKQGQSLPSPQPSARQPSARPKPEKPRSSTLRLP